MTPKTLELSDIFESAWETISAALPPLLLAKKKVEGVTTSSMRYMFEGPLGVWDIEGELKDFLAAIKPRFDDCSAKTNVKTSVILELYPDFATAEGGTMAAEIDVDGRIKQNVATPVRAVIHALARCANKADEILLPTRVEYSSSKFENVKTRPKGSEPDLVFKVGPKGRDPVRVLGEFKMCTTVDLAELILDPNSKKAKSFRNLLGRDMREAKLKYGFISTYKETILLRIEPNQSNPEEYALYYSRIFHDDIATHLDKNTNVQEFGTRFAIFFLLHKVVVDGGGKGYRLKGTEIPDQNQWFSTKLTDNDVPARVASRYVDTPSPSYSKPNRRLRPKASLLDVMSPHKAAASFKKSMQVIKDTYKRTKQNNSRSPTPRSPPGVSFAPLPKSAEYSEVAGSYYDDGIDDSEYRDDDHAPSEDDELEEVHEVGTPITPLPLRRSGRLGGK
ncbi:hypothetical protein J4E83_009605 [Alternaria metachromatica]|uniref:uncharacterized protein n=1 Tax=Alternaria metachromatica TaxID=283354 RepID=UPI0020C3F289|nr:uncharacterized protein J4E83_009605 [Alternaria metachromatica]KAI4607422.1 hypothetical protein J4E83_009605 [Alternaria metachromatica]